MLNIKNDNFDIKQIADSGQIFRMNRVGEDRYRLLCGSRLLDILVRPDGSCDMDCSREQFDGFWKHYFDLETDYGRYIRAIPPEDSFLTAAAAYSSGIRILNQDPWEMLISFIISQRKNIPAIKASIEKICSAFGDTIGSDGAKAFPSPKQLSCATLDDLRGCSLGYRAEYVYEAAHKTASGEYDLEDWRKLDDDALLARLMTVKGVGIKVASCTMLFGYHRIGAFPVDVWIKRMTDTYYKGGFPLELYEGFAGVEQQYIYYYGRELALGASKTEC